MRNGKKCTAIVLSAGSGRRMGGPIAKQYMCLLDKPVLWYSLHVLENCDIIDECILAVGEQDVDYVRENIVAKYGFSKVKSIIKGGSERYWSVLNALRAMPQNEDGYVFIHDGARPFLTEKILEDTCAAVVKFHACVAAVPSKDTVKLSEEDGFVQSTPDRTKVWSIQTPQVFEKHLITGAYEALKKQYELLLKTGETVTDDAGVVERFGSCRVKLVEASYRNIKITTPEDLQMAEAFLKEQQM